MKKILNPPNPLPMSFPHPLCHSRENGNPSLYHCELSKKVWQSHYSFISFIFCICIISSHTYSSHYNYTLILIFLLKTIRYSLNNLFIPAPLMSFRYTLCNFCSHLSFPFRLCHSRPHHLSFPRKRESILTMFF